MTSAQLLAYVPGMTYRQLDHWVSRGYLKPDNPHPGNGVARSFRAVEARIAAEMFRLVRSGTLPAVAAVVAREEVLAPSVSVTSGLGWPELAR